VEVQFKESMPIAKIKTLEIHRVEVEVKHLQLQLNRKRIKMMSLLLSKEVNHNIEIVHKLMNLIDIPFYDLIAVFLFNYNF